MSRPRIGKRPVRTTSTANHDRGVRWTQGAAIQRDMAKPKLKLDDARSLEF